jgi:hypothetical protein
MAHALTRTSIFATAGALAAAGVFACSSGSNQPIVPGNDAMAVGDARMGDGGGGNGGMATITDAAPREFGYPCDGGADCNSGVCFVGNMRTFCSSRCEAGSDCPMPPTLGICNTMGYCKS